MRFSSSWFAKEIRVSYNPLFSFFPFAAANFLLSYFTLPDETKMWIALAGFSPPLALFFLRPPGKIGEGEPAWQRELFPRLHPWVWPALGLLAFWPRFYQLTSLSTWPFTDEGYFSFFSVALAQKWSWRFFFTWSQQPPFPNWLLGLFFKLFQPSLFSLWLFPALLSAATAVLGYFCVRGIFPKSFAFFSCAILGCSFWPVYTGRICLPLAALLLWHILCLAILSAYWKAASPGRPAWAVLLGAATGSGFFVAVAWPVVALSLTLAFFSIRRRSQDPFERKGFLAVLAAFAAVFLLVSFVSRNSQYAAAIWGFYPGMDWGRQVGDFLTHLGALFWGVPWRRLYGPVWGGLLNPVLGSLFFVGFLEFLRYSRRPFSRWVLASFGLFLLPAFAARGYDSFRILPALPLATVFCATGLQALLSPLGPRKRLWTVILILGISAGLDFHHLFGRFHQLWGTPGNAWNFGKEYELWKSHDILQRINSEMGPGALLFDLRTHVDDVTSTVAAYSFDASYNPSIPFWSTKWAAVLVDANYLPFLSKRFPEGRFYWLCPKEPYGWWALAVIPMLPQTREALGKWFGLNQRMQAATREIIDTIPGNSRESILGQIDQFRNEVEGDPFLESLYWEKIFDNRSMERDAAGCLDAARHCVLEGYPLPDMYNEQGVILVQMGRYQEARRAFEKALKTDGLKLTPALENLQALNTAGK